ncbi:MAG: xanthine dehydrogenase accessory protein XdhC [Aquabacterium sp.]|uniref:xanthine dehydrogenase accessory protein XdhC n=1 Tax=Aquabacterium sp. TaxID=1872578 RepID=UPI002726119F|nr:xanthine dehydrogenase accessory protein XdhC [Aquabacterium sp.]MDO9001975.1 xanthine dehydrogenase accessory protein XdhC [Aquabacterium sp.]
MSSLSARALRRTAEQWWAAHRHALVISVDEIKGSTPRGTGTRMLVSTTEVDGTIGGGHLEWQAIDLARHALQENAQPTAPWTRTFPLGPTLGQCCGGVVTLRFAPLNDATLADWALPPPRFHLELHGAGHVGQAIVRLLVDLDCTVRWIDERAEDARLPNTKQPGLPSLEMLASLPPHIQWLDTDAAEHEVRDSPTNACHLVLTHRHDLDLRIIDAVLRRGDFRFAGLIGSQTKRAKFRHRLTEQGITPETLDRLTCPIGLSGVSGKEPAVIAIAVLAQLLQNTAPPHQD